MNITSKIEGYENLTNEEKLAKLEELEIEDNAQQLAEKDNKLKHYKDLIDKASSEASSWKKKFNEKLSESEKQELEQKESQAKIMEELETLKKEKQISEYKASYLGLGYDQDLASDTAQALINGDMAKVFANQKTFIENNNAKVKADLLANTPTPIATKGAKVQTEEEKLLAQMRKYAGLPD